MAIERRLENRNRVLSIVNLLVCFQGILALAFSISLRVIQTNLVPHQSSIFNLTLNYFDKLNNTFEYLLITTLVLSGLIVDLVGPRIILAIAVASAIIANYLFSTCHTLNMLFACRLATEFSHVFVLMSVLVLGSHWLSRRDFAIFVGLVFSTLLTVPALIATPLQHIVDYTIAYYLNFFITVLGCIILTLIVVTQSIPDKARRKSGIYGHFYPLRYYKIWLIGLVAMIGWMSNTFLLNFGAYYLKSRNNFSISEAVHVIHIGFICFGLGCLIMGIISRFFTRKRLLIAISYCLASICFAAIVYIPNLSTDNISLLIYAIEFLVSSNIVCYIKSQDYCTNENSGLALGLILSISTVGCSIISRMIFHYINNYIYYSKWPDNHWDTIVMVLPATLIIGSLILLFLSPPDSKLNQSA